MYQKKQSVNDVNDDNKILLNNRTGVNNLDNLYNVI